VLPTEEELRLELDRDREEIKNILRASPWADIRGPVGA
jgi:hypothetical protein